MQTPESPLKQTPQDALDDEISLAPHLRSIWGQRKAIALRALVAGVGAGVLVSAWWAMSPVNQTASIGFRLPFLTPSKPAYPNGEPFDPAEIARPEVVAEVFARQDLERFITLPDLQLALFVAPGSTKDLALLTRRYEADVADPKLTAAERRRLEELFESQRRDIVSQSYSMMFRRQARLSALPTHLTEAILLDVLATWARGAATRAVQRRTSLSLDSLVSLKALQEREYLVAADELEQVAQRLQVDIAELRKVPYASTLRTKAGLSLDEIETNIASTLRLDVQPLDILVKNHGLARNAADLYGYAFERFEDRRVDRARYKKRAARYRATLRDFAALPTNLIRELLAYNRDIEKLADAGATPPTSSQGGTATAAAAAGPELVRPQTIVEELAFRRSLLNDALVAEALDESLERTLVFYRDLAALAHGKGERPLGSPQDIRRFEAAQRRALDRLAEHARQLTAFHEELTAALAPASGLYVLTAPFMEVRERTVTAGAASGFVIGAILLTVFLSAGIVLWRHSTSPSEEAPAHR